MWVFYLISLPLTLGMVIVTLRYFAGPRLRRYVLFTVGYTWFCSLSIIILVPADIWTTISHSHETGVLSFFWSWSYWNTFLLTWAVVPLIQGFEDAGDFTVMERLKTSIHVNLIFYLVVGFIGVFGLILLILMHAKGSGDILGFAMGCSNTFGLVTGAFLLGFGLIEIPKSIWRNADWTTRQKVLSHKIAKMAVKLDDAHQELSNAIVVAQATSNQMSKRDPLRPYMNVIDNMLSRMFRDDPSFKPQGGRLGENDMDYDTDEKSMATLRRHLRRAREEYYRYKSEYMTYVVKALELEDTVKNYERRSSTGWRYISTLRPARSGNLGSIFDTIEFLWKCILRKQLEKVFAIILCIMSAAILLAEATLLPSLDLSLFSMLVKSVKQQEVLVQVFAFVPLMYMCVCTYYSLLKIGMYMFYSLTPRQTSSVNLLMICSMVARYAPPISYNFLNLIRLDENEKTIFESRMGNIDAAVPFFGKKFNRIYPLIMVIYTLLVASNFFDRIINFFGSWKRFRFETEKDDTDGFDPSGLIILQRERSWLEQGHKLGEHVIPLARYFNGVDVESHGSINIEEVVILARKRFAKEIFAMIARSRSKKAPLKIASSSKSHHVLYEDTNRIDVTPHYEKLIANTDGITVEMKATTNLINGSANGSSSRPSKETRTYSSNKDAISSKYAAIKDQNKKQSKPVEKDINLANKVSLLGNASSQSADIIEGASSGLATKWESMKMGFQSLKANIGAKKFLPLRQIQETATLSRASSSQSLDEIFQRLKRQSDHEQQNFSDEDDHTMEIKRSDPTR